MSRLSPPPSNTARKPPGSANDGSNGWTGVPDAPGVATTPTNAPTAAPTAAPARHAAHARPAHAHPVHAPPIQPRSAPGHSASAAHSARHRMARRFAAPIRWLHIYLSMFGLAAVLFFGATGLTLNHPNWFGEAERRVTARGQLDVKWLHPDAPATPAAPAAPAAPSGNTGEADESRQVAKLEVVEYLRKTHGIRGALAEFRVDERECGVTFKGPGYAADAFINRATGSYDLTQTSHGLVAVINDLHKGRDAGRAWSIIIDASAALMVVISLTGLLLLLYIKRRRMPGLVAAAVGTAVVAAVVAWLVP